jgi:hypothetical protein
MPRTYLFALFLLLALVPAAYASNGHPDHVSLFQTITVPAEETSGDIACAFCTLNVQGRIAGNVAVLFGTVNVEPSRIVSGDVALLFGTLRLDEDSVVRGDLAALFSATEIASTAVVQGSHAVVPRGFALGVLLAPLLISCGTVWLIVYLVRRGRQPSHA